MCSLTCCRIWKVLLVLKSLSIPGLVSTSHRSWSLVYSYVSIITSFYTSFANLPIIVQVLIGTFFYSVWFIDCEFDSGWSSYTKGSFHFFLITIHCHHYILNSLYYTNLKSKFLLYLYNTAHVNKWHYGLHSQIVIHCYCSTRTTFYVDFITFITNIINQ